MTKKISVELLREINAFLDENLDEKAGIAIVPVRGGWTYVWRCGSETDLPYRRLGSLLNALQKLGYLTEEETERFKEKIKKENNDQDSTGAK